MREDLQTAIRSLRKAPAFSIVALVVLALGIGAATAVFSVVDAVVLRALPFDEHDRIVAVLEYDTKRPVTFGGGSTTPQMYLDWRAQQQSFEALAAVGTASFGMKNESGHPEDVRAVRMTSEFFPVFRVHAAYGRAFTRDDEIVERHRVAILSYGFALRRFGNAADAPGKAITLNDETWEIVGVMPRGFAYPVASDKPTDIYVPIAFANDDKVRGGSRSYNFRAIGRLKPGVTIAQASEQMNAVVAALDAQYPKWSPGRRVRVIRLQEHVVGAVKSWMLMLLGAVGIVLLIACANVANLMLARATVRAREIGIRAALGASRWILVRGLIVEGLMLSLGGAAIGVVLAWAGVHAIIPWLPAGLPRVASIGIDMRVLGAAVSAAVLTGVVFGIVPALHASRPDLSTVLKDSGRSTTAGTGSLAIRNALVVLEVALAVVLLVGAGLFIGSFAKLTRIDPGFDYHGVLTVYAGTGGRLSADTLKDARARAAADLQAVFEAVRRVPEVDTVAAMSGGLPLTNSWSRNRVTLPGRGELTGDDDSINMVFATPGYLELLKLSLARGRYITADDRVGSQPVIVINEAAARRYWPGEEALGQRITINSKERVVIGVVGDIRQMGPEQPARHEGYMPMTQDSALFATLVMRTKGDPLRALPGVKAAVWSVHPDQRFSSDTYTLDGYMDRLLAQRRFNMALLSLFGFLGLVIAAVGIYGIMAYVVAQRTSEIRVRMALGATRGRVVAMVLRRAAVLVAAGITIGSLGAWFLARSLSAQAETLLFDVRPNDVRFFGGALVTLGVAALAASALPARRAASVDPLIALRDE
jgi:putative ABC transport system permease protein